MPSSEASNVERKNTGKDNNDNGNRLDHPQVQAEGGGVDRCKFFFNFFWYLLEPGSGKLIRPWEAPLVYASPLLVFFLCLHFSFFEENNDKESEVNVLKTWCNDFSSLVFRNAIWQGSLFLIVVQIPTLLTGHMSYVDIGWPTGLVFLAYHVLTYMSDNDNNNNLRVLMIGIALALHGGRMAIGAIVLFFPYHWKEDLSRYQYAEEKWIKTMSSLRSSPSSASWWWLKQQQETLFQAFFNTFLLACPLFICITDPTRFPSTFGIEIIGFFGWVFFWCMENYADMQKSMFLKAAKQNGDNRTAVLGHPPYDKPFRKYGLWTLCRHPNYFCEFMCWNSFLVMCIPSCYKFMEMMIKQQQFVIALVIVTSLALNILYVSRMFYDCLLFWTGAEPSEIRSVQRRPQYRIYQQSVPMFFPKILHSE